MKHQHKTCLRVALSKVSRLWSLPVSSSGCLIKGAKDNTHGTRACVGTKRTLFGKVWGTGCFGPVEFGSFDTPTQHSIH